MKVIVTEAGTEIGNKIVSFFLEKGHEVISIAGKPTDVKIVHKELTVFEEKQLLSQENKLNGDAMICSPESLRKGNHKSIDGEGDPFQYLTLLLKIAKVDHIVYFETIVDDDFSDLFPAGWYSGGSRDRPALTFIKTDFIICSGSPSFEAIRNVVEKIPVMILPNWAKAPCNPAGIDDFLEKLHMICGNENCFNKSYTLGSDETVILGKMILKYAKIRGMIRLLISLPFPASVLSAYLLRFIAKTPLCQSNNLVTQLKSRYKNRKAHKKPGITTSLSHTESLKLALGFTSALRISKKSQNPFLTQTGSYAFEGYTRAPVYGCFHIKMEKTLQKEEVSKVLGKIHSIGSNNQWYFINWLWHFKGWTSWLTEAKRDMSFNNTITEGDNLDFWKVQIAVRDNLHILLYADLFLPGEGWLEFKIIPCRGNYTFRQTLIFRPLGFTGRFYWFWTILLNRFFLNKIMNKLTSV